MQSGLFGHILHHLLKRAARARSRNTHSIVAHASNHVQIHHRHNSLEVAGEVDALLVGMLHPVKEELRTHQALFLSTEEGEDDASWRAYLFKMLRQLEHYGISTCIIVGTGMNAQRVGTARTRVLATHAQMVVMRTYDDVFVPQLFVGSRKHRDDVMCGALLRLSVGEIVIEAHLLLTTHNGFQLEAAQLADNEFRSKRVAASAGISATKLLRSEVFHCLSHVVEPHSRTAIIGPQTLSVCLRSECES